MPLRELVPPQFLGQRELRRQALLLIYGIVLGIFSTLVIFVVLVWAGPLQSALLSLVWTLPIGLSFFVLRFADTPRTAAQFFVFVVTLGVTVTYIVHGGYALIAFIGLPLAAGFLLEPKSGLLWTFGAVAGCLLLGLEFGAEQSPWFTLAIAGMTLCTGLAACLNDLLRASTMAEAEQGYTTLVKERSRGRHVLDTLFPALLDLDGTRMTYVGEGIEQLLGYPPVKLLGQDLLALVHADDVQTTRDWIAAERPEQNRELRLRHFDGRWVWFKFYLVPHVSAANQYTLAGYDMSAEHSAREQAVQTQRLDSIRVLAGGAAHDFNNLLTVITGFAELLDESDARRHILGATGQASELVQKLMAFGAVGFQHSPAGLDIVHVLSSLKPDLERLLGETVALHFNLPEEPCWVRVPATEINQMMISLVTNAQEALSTGGNVWIDVEVDDQALADVPYLEVSVTDDGPGMTVEVRARAFEPFYSTKQNAEGAGLGLAGVYGIAKQAGGSVHIDSEPGKGVGVHLRLPMIRQGVSKSLPGSLVDYQHGNGHILVVEDDELVADVISRCLVAVGYSVTIKHDVESAWDTLKRNLPDLLVADIMMPDGRGTELAARLHEEELGLGLPILFISAYADHELAALREVGRSALFLAKPFRSKELLACVGQLLGTHRTRAARDDRTGTY